MELTGGVFAFGVTEGKRKLQEHTAITSSKKLAQQ